MFVKIEVDEGGFCDIWVFLVSEVEIRKRLWGGEDKFIVL